MKVTREYHEGTDVLKFEREEHSNIFWSEHTYDEKGCVLTYKDSNGYYIIKGVGVTKEEFENFINKEMETLTAKQKAQAYIDMSAKQKAQAYIYLFGEDGAFFEVEKTIKEMGNNVKYKHLLEVLEEIKKY